VRKEEGSEGGRSVEGTGEYASLACRRTGATGCFHLTNTCHASAVYPMGRQRHNVFDLYVHLCVCACVRMCHSLAGLPSNSLVFEFEFVKLED